MFIVICVLCWISVSSAQQHENSSLTTFAEEQEFISAQTLYRDSCFQLAREQFTSFISRYPNSIRQQEAMFLLADCFFQSSQFQLAALKYDEFIYKYPTSYYVPEVYCKLGQTYVHLNKIPDAIRILKIILDNYGERKIAGEAAYWIGESYLHSGDMQNAVKYYTLAYENYPRNRFCDDAIYSIAWIYQNQLEFSKASEWYEKLISVFPQSPLISGAHIRIGESYYFAKNYHRAINELQKSRENIHGEEALGNADYLIAEAFFKLGDFAEAQKRYEQFLMDHPQHNLVPEIRYDLGWLYLKQKEFSKSIETFGVVTSRSDELGQAALYQRSVAERLSGKEDTSLNTLNEVIVRNLQNEWLCSALYDAGVLLFERGKFSKAKLYFQRLTTEYPKSEIYPDGCLLLGECLIVEGNFKDAMQWFDQAVLNQNASFETRVNARFRSAQCSLRLKNFREATEKFGVFISTYQKHPKTIEARYWQAEAAYRLGSYDSSFAAFQEVASSSVSKEREVSLYGAAWSFYKLGFYTRAIELFEKLIVEFPKSNVTFDSRLRIADAYCMSKDYKKAIDSYRSVIRLYPDSTSIDYAYYQLGMCYLKDGDISGSFNSFGEFIKALPKSPLADDAQFSLGWINERQKEYSEAIKEFQKLVREYPTSELVPLAYCELGDCFCTTKQYVPAEQAYLEVVRRYPQSMYADRATSSIRNSLSAQEKESDTTKVATDTVKGDLNIPVPQQLKVAPEKISREDSLAPIQITRKQSTLGDSRGRETVELLAKNENEINLSNGSKYAGMVRTGLGTYFTPLVKFQFGQVLQDFHYAIDFDYHLTKGFATYTDQSGGRLSLTGGTILRSTSSIFNNTTADGRVDLSSESYNFYGSEKPATTRDVSNFRLQTTATNKLTAPIPYIVDVMVGNLDVTDSSTTATEVQFGIGGKADFSLYSIPIQVKVNLLAASGGLWFTDLAATNQYHWLERILIQASLHLYWASGTVGQDIVRLRPNLSVNYQLDSQHRVFVAYDPSIIPMTRATYLSRNRYFALSSNIRHKDITDAGEVGVESEWSETLQSKFIVDVHSMRDNAFFSPVQSQPGWVLVYGGRTTIVTARAEMVAKLTVNDYFGASLLFRSAEDSFLGKRLPYVPAMEGGCNVYHQFDFNARVGADIHFIGKRYEDTTSNTMIPGFVVLNITGEYTLLDYLKVSLGILNLMNSKYYLWKGYQEFPLTVHFAVQLNW